MEILIFYGQISMKNTNYCKLDNIIIDKGIQQ